MLTHAHRQVDYACIEELVEWHVKEGTSGIVPCGTTGESPTLSEEEHFKVIETVVKKAAGRIQVQRRRARACAPVLPHVRMRGPLAAALTLLPPRPCPGHCRRGRQQHQEGGGGDAKVQGPWLHCRALRDPLLQQAHAGGPYRPLHGICSTACALPPRASRAASSLYV